MRHAKRLIVTAVFFLVSTVAPAEDSSDGKYALHKLLDVETSSTERQAIFDHLKDEAASGKTSAQYLVGSLYRIGKKLDANVVDADSDAAKKYLSIAAAHGRIIAMAKMAELELGAKHPMEAMIWAQLYNHYKIEFEPTEKNKNPGGYAADLLHRVQLVFDQKQLPQMTQYFGGFIAQHDADIRAGLAESRATDAGGSKMEERVQKLHYESNVSKFRNVNNDDLAEYVLHRIRFIKRRSQQLWLLDALPDVALGKELRAIATHVRVTAEAGTTLRYAHVPIVYSFGQFTLRPAK